MAPLMPPPPRRPPRLRPWKPSPPHLQAWPGAPHWRAPPWRRPDWPRRPRRTPTLRRAWGRLLTGHLRTCPAPTHPRLSHLPTACRTSTRWPPWVSLRRGDQPAGALGATGDAGVRQRPVFPRTAASRGGLCPAPPAPAPGAGLPLRPRSQRCPESESESPRAREPPHLLAPRLAPPNAPHLDLSPVNYPVSGSSDVTKVPGGHLTLGTPGALPGGDPQGQRLRFRGRLQTSPWPACPLPSGRRLPPGTWTSLRLGDRCPGTPWVGALEMHQTFPGTSRALHRVLPQLGDLSPDRYFLFVYL